jgi:hypothetical protein
MLAVLTLTLTGCADDDHTYSANTWGDAPSVERPPAESPKEVGYRVLREQNDAFDLYTDAQIDNIAEATCAAWDDGLSSDAIFFAGADTHGADQGALMALAANVYCPEHLSALNDWLGS